VKVARSWVVVPAVLALAYAVAVVAASWIAPEKGFLAFTGQRVVYVEPGGPAARAGITRGDRIVAVDGIPITSTLDYTDRVNRRDPDELVLLGISRGDTHLDVPIQLEPSDPPWAALFATLLAAALIVLGLMARIGRPDDPAARRFYRTSCMYAVVYVGALSWPRLMVHPVLGIAFLAALFTAPAVALDLAIDFPHRSSISPSARLWRRIAYTAGFGLGAVCAAAIVIAVRDYREGAGDRALYWVVGCVATQMALIALHAAVAVAFQLREVRSASGPARAQLRWLLFGQVMSALPALASIPFALADLEMFLLVRYRPFVVAVALAWSIAYGLAVLRVRLADADALIRSSAGYAVATATTLALFGAVVLATGWFSGGVIAAFVAALLFGPIRTRTGRWLDRRFFRDRGHYVEALRRVGESLALLRAPDALAKEAVEQVVGAVHAQRGALYLLEDGAWKIAHGDGYGAEPVAPEDGIAIRVATVNTNDPVAVLVLGPRKSGDMYSSQDKDLLGALASQLGIALGNARAFGTITELSKTLEAQNAEIRGLRDRLEDENRFLRARIDAALEGATLIGESRAIRELTKTIERVARSDASVLVLGESGTGKTLVARTLHAASPRSAGPFLHVDCGAIAASVFESELFGHERGAFTGAARMRRGPVELADGGTLFLDEIGELPLELQPKLLRVLEDKSFLRVGGTQPVTVDVRIIAATHRDLDDMVAAGQLREDLYFRLRVVELVVPPLRQRRGDIPALCESLLPRVAKRCGRRMLPLSADALARMAAYGWPGNVRELENVLERALVLCETTEITAADLELPDRPAPPEGEVEAPHDEVMESIERKRLTSALRAAGGNQSHAAKSLGMPRTTFINKLRRYGLL
jgi:transcriptional regulator with GAF, ATPase, and Fis domain